MECVTRVLSVNKKDEYGYELAYRLACEKLAGVNVEEQCRRSGATCQDTGTGSPVNISYLNQICQIAFPDVAISCVGEELRLREKILLLHYFIQAKGTPLSGEKITYKEVPGTGNYFRTFQKRAIKPILDCFGQAPERLIEVARKLGSQRADIGDVSVTIDAFSRVPVTLVMWRGDKEFAPEGSIMFDSTISDYLSIEDINVLCETIAWKLVRLLKTEGE